jgi:subtilase family serine protease
VVSTGDSGAATTACPPALGSAAVKGVDLPASDPLVLSVGGTSLHAAQPSGDYHDETAWNLPTSAGGPRAGGGGFSRLVARPSFQDGVAGIGATRGVPDVAADADPRTGLALVIIGSSGEVHLGAGGTSAAAPLWAGVVALADQQAGRPLGNVDPALYTIARGAHGAAAFHDVTSGDNSVTIGRKKITGYTAARGWDAVTGWGSPDAAVLIPLLAAAAS